MDYIPTIDLPPNYLIYRIYVRSFFDSDGDGIGDLRGIISKLSYFTSIGIDTLCLSSLLESDGEGFYFGVTDHSRINPALGTIGELKELLNKAHDNNLRVFLSFPLSFTSLSYSWFEKSRASTALNPYREYYVWRAGKGKSAPEKTRTVFKTPLWAYDEKSGEWYRCLHGEKYPDLNYENPRVRKEILDALRFWREQGVDGFIVENAHFATDKILLPDQTPLYKGGEDFFTEGKGLFRMLRDIKEKCDDTFPLLLDTECTVSGLHPYLLSTENPVADAIINSDCIAPDSIIDKQSFSIKEFIKSYLSIQDTNFAKKTILAFESKDHSRLLSRITAPLEAASCPAAKLLAALLFSAKALPSLYQGEEIGMTDFTTFKPSEHKGYTSDPNLLHARSPFHWDNNPNGAFTESAFSALPVNDNYHKINLLTQSSDGESVFSFYRRIILFRKNSSALQHGSFRVFPDGNILCYLRESEDERILIVANPSAKPLNAKLPKDLAGKSAHCELSNYAIFSKALNATMGLRPYEVRFYRLSAPLPALN